MKHLFLFAFLVAALVTAGQKTGAKYNNKFAQKFNLPVNVQGQQPFDYKSYYFDSTNFDQPYREFLSRAEVQNYYSSASAQIRRNQKIWIDSCGSFNSSTGVLTPGCPTEYAFGADLQLRKTGLDTASISYRINRKLSVDSFNGQLINWRGLTDDSDRIATKGWAKDFLSTYPFPVPNVKQPWDTTHPGTISYPGPVGVKVAIPSADLDVGNAILLNSLPKSEDGTQNNHILARTNGGSNLFRFYTFYGLNFMDFYAAADGNQLLEMFINHNNHRITLQGRNNSSGVPLDFGFEGSAYTFTTRYPGQPDLQAVTFANTGNVGIGINNPNEKIEVNGTARFYGNVGIGTAPSAYGLDVNATIRALNAMLTTVSEYADNAAALAAGLTSGLLYRTGDALKIVH